MNASALEHPAIQVNENCPALDLLQENECCNIARSGQITERQEHILVEHATDVYINERLTMKVICTPQYLAELVAGRLLTEGMISGSKDVKTIYLCESGRRARVYLNAEPESPAPKTVETIPTCCSGNRLLDSYFVNQRAVQPLQPIAWKASWVFQLADHFAEGMPLHSQTWSTHSCFLAREGQLLFQCEDIGRHNALDKAIGYALLHNIDLRQCLVYSSGRIPTDMVMKAIRAGIPLLASKGMPTQEATALAKEYGLTLVCAARRDRLKLYAGQPPLDAQKD